MKFIFYSPVAFEKWDWRNSVEKGIGGSETSHVEMAYRIARRGHEVITYAPIPEDCPGEWRDTKWYDIEKADISQSGIWVLYRCPKFVDKFDATRTDQPKWLIMQDWSYEDLTPDRVKKFDRIVPLCHAHERWLINRWPFLEGKTWVTRNGIKLDLIEEVEKDPPKRNMKRIMYASSPDRGLLAALKIFKRAKEYDPELELHITYGWNNLDKLIGDLKQHPFRKMKEECLKLIDETGAVFHGRISQNQLYREWLQTAVNVYCTTFWETGYITGLEGMALGAIPIFSPIWAQGENLDYGVAVPGDPGDPLTLARFTGAVLRVTNSEEGQNNMRPEMMEMTRRKWSWERFVDQWIEAGEEDLNKTREYFHASNHRPLLSIITPTIRPDGLPMLHESIKSQTYKNWEWLICTPHMYVNSLCKDYEYKDPTNVRIFEDPPPDKNDLYGLSKAWNKLIKEAKGDYIVFTTDWLWFEKDALEKLCSSVMASKDKPRRMVTAAPDHYDRIISLQLKPENRVWEDYRGNAAEFFEIGPEGIELVLAIVPKEDLIAVGGFDETYDQVSGLSEKEIGLRLKALRGYKFYVDKSIECRSAVHDKEFPEWDKKFPEACRRFGKAQEDLLLGQTKKLNYLETV